TTKEPPMFRMLKPSRGRRLELEDLEQRLVLSPISDRYAALGGPNGFLGQALYPAKELVCSDGIGRFERFQGGNIYWSPWTGAQEVHGAVLDKYISLGRDFLGYPTTDTMTTVKGDGLYCYFEGGLIEAGPVWGAHEVHGAILAEFAKLGLDASFL